ncbi:hypothetical protein P7C70_g328, partial [Phenoliferia sp. Uapishka_3]
MDRYQPLPVSSLALSALSHPLLALLSSPLHPRLAYLESHLLLSQPASLLASLGLSPASISTLVLATLAGVVALHRKQWRFFLAAMGVLEAVGRSLKLLDTLDEGEQNEKDQKKAPDMEEARHLVAFWIVFAVLQSVETWRAAPTSLASPLPSLALQILPRSLQRVVSYISRSLRGSPTSKRATFPQPTPLLTSLLHQKSKSILPLPLTPKYAILKLLFLWTALRKDGTGAIAIWDWVIKPFFVVGQKRGGGRTRRVVVIESGDCEISVIESSARAGKDHNYNDAATSERGEQDSSPPPPPAQQDLFNESPPTSPPIPSRPIAASIPTPKEYRIPQGAYSPYPISLISGDEMAGTPSPSPRKRGYQVEVEGEGSGWPVIGDARSWGE